MTVEIHRRGFLAGLGAAIVMRHGLIGDVPTIDRTFAPFTIQTNGAFTAQHLFQAVNDLGLQVRNLGPLSCRERLTVSKMIDDAIDEIRPIRLLVKISAPLESIASGEFAIEEEALGVVNIKAHN